MKALLMLGLLSTLLLAGCSGKDGGATPPQDEEGRYIIRMTSGNRFMPADASIPVGGTVLWINDGGVHDVHAEDGSFASGTSGGMRPGDEFEHTFDAAGSWTYFCDVHHGMGMTGKVTVE